MQNQLKKIFSRIRPFFTLQKGSAEQQDRQVKLYGEVYSILQWDEAKYEDALREVTKIYSKNGTELVETHFSNALTDILIGLNPLEEAATRMHTALIKNVKKRFTCIPLQGLDFRLEKANFGFGTLLGSEHGVLPQIINDRESLHSYQHTINALNECSSYLQVESETDHKNSIDQAIFFANYLTALLSLYVGSSQYRTDHQFRPWHKRVREAEVGRKRKIAIYGSEASDSQVYYEYYINDSPLRKSKYSLEFNLLSSGHDSNESLNECLEFFRPEDAKTSYHLVDASVIDEMLSRENEKLLSCVSRKNTLDKKLFHAVSWFGKAVNCDSCEDQFLFFAIAIESLLVGEENSGEFSSQGSINQKISERSAYLSAETYEQRRQTEKDTKTLYGIRSKIVHTGAKATNQDVISIEKLARKLIFNFVKRKFESEDAFLKWLKICQYGAGV
ncbi:MAG TPA: hypothetical protein VFP33_03090 [Gallionella sp.]|nr:hypothetical protein [Gallionella sp.]